MPSKNKTETKAKVEEVKEEVKVETKKSEPVVVQDKFVKVTPKIAGKKFIAGTWYEFTKDKETSVTQEAKRILREAGAIYI